jgi:hypothetical protein
MKTINTSQRIVIPKKWGNHSSQEILDTLNSVSDNDIKIIWEEIELSKESISTCEDEDPFDISNYDDIDYTIFWDEAKVINDLFETYIEVEDDVEVYWYKWKYFHVNLPDVWDFNWFKFDFFVSYDNVSQKDFLDSYELRSNSFSLDDFYDILNAFNLYMETYWLGFDWDGKWDFDYYSLLKYRESNKESCRAWIFFKTLFSLTGHYWLANKYIDSHGKQWAAVLYCNKNYFSVDQEFRCDWRSNLLLRL